MTWHRVPARAIFGAALAAVVVLATLALSSAADAAYSDMPNTLPDGDPNVFFTVSAGSRTGTGSNLLQAPDVWLKVYTRERSAKQVTVNFGHSCEGQKMLVAYKAGASEQRLTTTGKNLGSRGSSCSNLVGTLPANLFSNQTSNVEGHAGLYVAFLNIKMVTPPSPGGPLSTFKVSVQGSGNNAGAKLSTWGLWQNGYDRYVTGNHVDPPGWGFTQAYIGRPSPGSDTISSSFKPPCNFFDDGQRTKYIWLNWFDDDKGTGYESQGGPLEARLRIWRGGNLINDLNMASAANNPANDRVTNFRWGGEAGKGIARILVADGERYTLQFDNVARSNGIEVWSPFDSADFNLECPPDTGWRLTSSSATQGNVSKVAFDPVNQPTVPQPNQSAHEYTIGMGCGAYNNQTNRDRCRAWNDYYQANRDRAVDALKRVRFNHKLTNRQPEGDRRHVTAPGNSGGCDGAAIRTHCSRIQYRVHDVSTGGWSDWYWRFSDSSPTSAAKETTQPVNHRGYTANVDRGAGNTRTIWREAWNTPDRPQGMPPATKEMSDSQTNTPGGLHGLLKNPQAGDQYCERVASKNRSSYSGERLESQPRCVTLKTGGGDESDPYWNLKPLVSVRDLVEQGANVTPTAQVKLPVKDTDYDSDDDINETGPDGYGATGETYTSATANWQVTRFILPNGRALEELGDIGLQEVSTTQLDPCQWVGAQAPGSRCDPKAASSTTFQPQSEPTGLPPSGDMPAEGTDSLAIGSQLCFLTSVSRPQAGHPNDTQPSMTWRHSKATCATVAKFPKVQFQGGDVQAGRGFFGWNMEGTSRGNSNADLCPVPEPGRAGEADITTTGVPGAVRMAPGDTYKGQPKHRYGSWVEYGAFATGRISGFGTGAMPTGVSFNAADDPTRLMFGNTQFSSKLYGGEFWASGGCQPDYFSWVSDGTDRPPELRSRDQTANRNLGGLNLATHLDSNPRGHIIKGKDITLTATNLAANQDRVLYAKRQGNSGGKIRISGNLTMNNGPYASIDEIPKFIIIADGDIEIAPNVTRVDAWLITRSTLSTCSNRANGTRITEITALTTADCGKQLAINGPINVQRLLLPRTYGADLTNLATGQGSRPAETFNLNPAHFLTNYAPSDTGEGDWKTVYEKDLPPRY